VGRLVVGDGYFKGELGLVRGKSGWFYLEVNLKFRRMNDG